MFFKLLLRLLLLAKIEGRILASARDSNDSGITYFLKIEKHDYNWFDKLRQEAKEAGIFTEEKELEEQVKIVVS